MFLLFMFYFTKLCTSISISLIVNYCCWSCKSEFPSGDCMSYCSRQDGMWNGGAQEHIILRAQIADLAKTRFTSLSHERSAASTAFQSTGLWLVRSHPSEGGIRSAVCITLVISPHFSCVGPATEHDEFWHADRPRAGLVSVLPKTTFLYCRPLWRVSDSACVRLVSLWVHSEIDKNSRLQDSTNRNTVFWRTWTKLSTPSDLDI